MLSSGEIDGNEWIKIDLNESVKAAKITVGALFDSKPDDGVAEDFDAYNAEVLEWIAYDKWGNEVGKGKVFGDADGLVDFYVNVGVEFESIKLKPVDNGVGNNGNNSDFLLVGVKTCDELCIEEKLQYALEDADGDYDWAKLTIDVLDGEPKVKHQYSTLSITIDEDGLPNGNNNNTKNPSGDKYDNEGGTSPGADEDGRGEAHSARPRQTEQSGHAESLGDEPSPSSRAAQRGERHHVQKGLRVRVMPIIATVPVPVPVPARTTVTTVEAVTAVEAVTVSVMP